MQTRLHPLFIALAAALSLQAQAATDPATTVSVIPGLPATTTSSTATVSASTPATAPTVTSTASTASTSTAAPTASDRIQSASLASDYAGWAGSRENAQSLVTGLRSGTPVTLLSSGSNPTPDAVTFSTPTQNMGWGSVSKALSLAQADLAAMGITNPTPQQIQAALTGGNITSPQGTTSQLSGVLTMRNQGMGWGQIAQKLNLQPGATFKPSATEHSLQSTHRDDGHHEETHHRTDPISGTHKRVESIQHDRHQRLADTHTSQSNSPRVTTAAGTQAVQQRSGTHHASEYPQAHLDHEPIARIVTASGAPVSAGASLSQASHGSGHAEIHQVSHITTAAGGQAFSGGGHGNEGYHGHH